MNTDKVIFEDFELGNGLKVILSRDKTIPSIAINICFHVGSKNEDINKTGYAHLLEHLMFEGSKNLKPGDYDRFSMLAGGENNAYTNEDKTNYYLLLPSNQVDLGLWLESDRMLEFAITKESLDKQKDVIIEEKKYIIDNKPFGSVNYKMSPRLYKKSSYRWDPIGKIQHIKKATLSDIRTFFNKFYVPNNAVLTITGDIELIKTEKKIRAYFENIPKNNNKLKYDYNENDLKNETIDYIEDNIHFPGIFIAYRIPKESSKEFYVLNLLSDILSDGDSSKLHRKLVYTDRLASDTDSYIEPKEFTSIFYITALLMPGIKISKSLNTIDNIIDDVIAGNISQREIEKAKNKIESRIAYRKQSILYKADMLSHYKMFYNNPELINTNFNNYVNIIKDDITEYAAKYLRKNNRVVLIYYPKKNIN